MPSALAEELLAKRLDLQVLASASGAVRLDLLYPVCRSALGMGTQASRWQMERWAAAMAWFPVRAWLYQQQR